jgi:anti-anti-sigma factor
VLNFAGTEYINSAGIAIIISLLTEARASGVSLVISGLSSHYQKIFRMVGLTQYAEVYDTVDEAVRELKNRTTVEPA